MKVDVPLQRHGAGGGLGPRRARRRVGPTDTVRFVTNDFMYTGGDGYTAFAAGTDVLSPGDPLLDVAIDYITAHSPVAPAIEGRVVGPVISARGGRLNVRPAA